VKLGPKERKLLILAFDPAASVGEAMNALRAVMKGWIERYPDGHALVKDLETDKTEVREKIVYRERISPYASVVLGFGRYRGYRLDEMPADYLEWVLENFDKLWPKIRRTIELYLEGQN
jgi:uncharacterized protein (DUF3820 family)